MRGDMRGKGCYEMKEERELKVDREGLVMEEMGRRVEGEK